MNTQLRPLAPIAEADQRPTGVARLKVERHASPDAIKREWRQLEASGVGTVFQRFDWVDAYVRHVLPHEDAEPTILLGRLDGNPAFVLPLAISRHGPALCAEWIGDGHAGYNFGLWSPEASSFMRELSRAQITTLLGEALAGVDCALLERMPRDHEGTGQPLAAIETMPSRSIGHAFNLGSCFTDVAKAHTSADHRKKIRQKERRMATFGEIKAGTIGDPKRAHAALDFFAAEKARWLAERNLVDPFAKPGVLDFFHDMIDRAQNSREPVFEMSELSVDGKRRAVFGSSIHKGRINVCLAAYAQDEILSCSPGEVLRFHHIEEACRRGLSAYDLGVGDQPYKASWCDIRRDLDDGYLAFTPVGSVTVAAVQLREGLKNRLQRSPVLWSGLKTVYARLSAAGLSRN